MPGRPTPGALLVDAYYLQRTRFNGIAERKLSWRQLTERGKVKIRARLGLVRAEFLPGWIDRLFGDDHNAHDHFIFVLGKIILDAARI
jgi:hypothetical protein